MSTGTVYHLFISHAWDYHEDYNQLVKLLEQARTSHRLNWKNYSVPRHDPLHADDTVKLMRELEDQIRPVHLVIVLCGMYAAYRKWIQAEIDIGQDYGKPIIGVAPRGQQRIPQEVQDAAREIVRWNTDSIVAAIRKWALR